MGDFLFTLKQMGFRGSHVAFEPQEQAHGFLDGLGSTVEKDTFNEISASKYAKSIDLVVMSHSLEHFNPGKSRQL